MSEDLEITYRDPAELKPYSRNSRTHSADQVRQIRRSMDEFTNYNPILLRDDEITIGAGHGRQLAALLKPPLPRVPTITLRGLSDEQWKALVIADNKLAENAGWDEGMLKLELADLQGAGFDLSLSGFSSLELTSIFSTQEGRTDPDEVPAAPVIPVSQPGDVWCLDEHRIICGDCTNKATVERVMEGRKIHLLTSDPPYGVSYDASYRSKALNDGARRAEGAVTNDDRADWREAWALFEGDVVYVWHADKQAAVVEASLHACGFETRNQIIWAKTRQVLGRGHYHSKHEPCFYMVRKGSNGHWSGDRKQSTVWEMDHPRSETGHSTQKPVEAFARPLRNNSQPGDRCYDPFLGSGSSLIAAQMNKRIMHGCEIAAKYVDVCATRWQSFTGSDAVLAETGETFSQVKERRQNARTESNETEEVL